LRGTSEVTRTVVVRSEPLPRRTFRIFVELEGMYRNMVEQLVLYAVNNGITKFTRLKAEKYREVRSLYPQLPSHYAYTTCQDAAERYGGLGPRVLLTTLPSRTGALPGTSTSTTRTSRRRPFTRATT